MSAAPEGEAVSGRSGPPPRGVQSAGEGQEEAVRSELVADIAGDRNVRAPSGGGRGFTLLELLAVIAIIAILAAVAAPTLNSFKPNITAAATRQLLGDVARARQLAISQRTTVYMVFVPTNFWTDPGFASLPPAEKEKAKPLVEKQLTGYTFVSLRGLGDQPGRGTPRYLAPWRTLPDGVFIPESKFQLNNNKFSSLIYTNNNAGSPILAFNVPAFNRTPNVPFPSAETERPGRGFASLPYIAFDYMGRLTSGQNELIPLARGSVLYPRQPGQMAAPSAMEMPPGNSTNAFTLINIDWLTGRAHVERQEVK